MKTNRNAEAIDHIIRRTIMLEATLKENKIKNRAKIGRQKENQI